MESPSLLAALLSTDSPLLPAPMLERAYLALAWAMVLGAGVLALSGRLWPHRRGGARAAALAAVLWCLLPGAVSPAYWLGLAFRAPSLLATLLCGGWLLSRVFPARIAAPPWPALRRWAGGPVWLGWILLADAFALGPISIYALGFAPLCLGALTVWALLPWMWRGEGRLSLLLGAALAGQVLLRLPTGNAWDAVLDPWLWIVLQFDWLAARLRRP